MVTNDNGLQSNDNGLQSIDNSLQSNDNCLQSNGNGLQSRKNGLQSYGNTLQMGTVCKQMRTVCKWEHFRDKWEHFAIKHWESFLSCKIFLSCTLCIPYTVKSLSSPPVPFCHTNLSYSLILPHRLILSFRFILYDSLSYHTVSPFNFLVFSYQRKWPKTIGIRLYFFISV